MASTTLAAARAEIKSNPSKVYVYVLSRPCGTPFYVGVGTGRRVAQHECYVGAGLIKASVHAIIHDLKSAGGVVGYAIAGWFDYWAQAAIEERRLIALYGRADLGLGTLANRTNGGQGTAGLDWHASSKRAEGARKSAEKNRGRKHTEEHKAKIAAALKGKPRPVGTGSKISAALKGRPLSANARATMSAVAKGRQPSPELLAAGAKWRAENAQLLSEKRKKIWADPAFRTKMSNALKGVKRSEAYSLQNRKRQFEKFKDPEFKRRWAIRHAASLQKADVREKLRVATARMWNDPVARAKMLEARRRAREARGC
jgi:hypothetical protein